MKTLQFWGLIFGMFLLVFQSTAGFAAINDVIPNALAQDIYIAQTARGNDSGVDSDNAHSVAWFNDPASWGPGAGNITPGTTIHLCDVISTGLNIQGSGTDGQPITILFEPNARLSTPLWDKISWERAAMRTSSVEHIVIDGGVNGVIESTDNGTELTHQETQIGVWLYGCSYCEVKNVTVHGMYVRTPVSDDSGSGIGISVSGSHVRIHHTTIAEAETGIAYNYPGGSMTEDVKLYNNHISRISNGITIGSGNTNALANDFEIYANDISDGFVWDGIRKADEHWFHNDGIQVWAVHDGSLFTNLRVHSNYIHGDMGRHITGWIFIEGNVEWPLVFNNVLVNTGTSYPANGMIASSGEIYENTIAMFNPGTCINAGPNSRIKNNLLYNCDTALGIHKPGNQTESDFNLFTFSGSFKNAVVDQSGTFRFDYSLEEWRTRGFDLNSRVTDPGFVNPEEYDFHLQPTSLAKDAGTGLPDAVSFDKDGLTRPQDNGWDIGAYEFAPALTLHGTPANQAIYLSWKVNTSLPTTTTWTITYEGKPGDQKSPITEIHEATRAYSLTGLTNYELYTITLTSMGVTPTLSDTISVTPTDRYLYLPLITR